MFLKLVLLGGSPAGGLLSRYESNRKTNCYMRLKKNSVGIFNIIKDFITVVYDQ